MQFNRVTSTINLVYLPRKCLFLNHILHLLGNGSIPVQHADKSSYIKADNSRTKLTFHEENSLAVI